MGRLSEDRTKCVFTTAVGADADPLRRPSQCTNDGLQKMPDQYEGCACLTAEPSAESATQRFTHDPMDLTPLEWDRRPLKGGLLTLADASMLVGKRQFHDHALVYLGEPLPEDATICGNPTFSVWVRLDVPDEDFFVALHEVKADGTTQQLGWD